MDKYFEALEKSKNQVTLGVLGQVGFDETAEVLEKGKKAAMGEIREWNGIKYQKTPGGWVPVKQQKGVSKTEPEKEEGKLELPAPGKEFVYECKDESGPSLIKVKGLEPNAFSFKKMVNGGWVGSGVSTAEGAQKLLANYTLDKEKNTPPAEKKSSEQNKDQQQKESKKAFTLKDFSEDEVENMSWDEFQKTFGKQANDFLRNLDDSAISAIGYGRKSDGTPTDYVVTHSYVPGSDENLEFELQREGGKYGYALMVARGATEETDEDGDSYWSGDGGKRLFIEGETTYNSAEEAVKALQERIKAVKNGEEIEFERW